MLVYFYLLLTIIFWGWSFVATKILLEYVTPVELMGLRFIVGLPVMYAIIAAKRLKLNFSAKDRRQILLDSAIITAHFLIQVTGMGYTSVTNARCVYLATESRQSDTRLAV